MRYLLHPGRFLARLGAFILVRAAQCALSRGEYPRAERLFGLRPHSEIRMSFGDQGRFDEAERVYRRAHAIFLAARGEVSLELAALYHNRGGLEHARGRDGRGEPFARRGLEIREQALGPAHPTVAADAAALAAILDGQGKRDEAEELFRRALTVFERIYGGEHYEVAVTLNNLGALCQAKGETEEAERLYRRALAIKEKRLGGSHPEVATTLNNLAVLCRSQARHAEAQRLYHRAMVIFHGALGPSHPSTQACGENYEALAGRAQ